MTFDPDFASPTDWANLYREAGLQVVPSFIPNENPKQWKRPITEWRSLQNELVPDFTFQRWYGENGEHIRRFNMGLITGSCSGNAFIVDLDTQKNMGAAAWWDEVSHLARKAGELDTVEQLTGGGGRQLLFRGPEGWTPPTLKTPIGVDIRGQGGFAVLPPSMHESGKRYRWVDGCAPWEIEIAEAPHWLCEKIDELAHQYGAGGISAGAGVKTASPDHTHNAFGKIIDGREDYAARFVWGRIVDLWRSCPIPMPKDEEEKEFREAFNTYERLVKSRLVEPGVPNHALLEKEGRGITMFTQKWNHAIAQWDTKVAEHGLKEPPRKHEAHGTSPLTGPVEGKIKIDPETGEIFRELPTEGILEYLDIKQIYSLPDPNFLIDGLVINSGLGFVFGPPGCGKSFITISMALSISAHLDKWWGRGIKKGGPVVYISSEGVGDIKFRIKAWELQNGIKAEQLPFYLIRQTINFMLASDVERLVKTVAEIASKHGNPACVFVDTVSRVLPGADENLQKDMTLFIGACDAVREAFESTVIGVHHTSRNGNLRGSTVFDGAGDFLLQVDREDGSMVGAIMAKKIKAAQDGWVQYFELKKVLIGDIGAHESLVAVGVDQPDQEEKKSNKWPEKTVLNKILDAMREAWDVGKPWSPHPQSRKQGRYAHFHMGEFGVNAKTADQILDQWSMNGVLSLEVRDKNTKLQGYRVIGRID
jgi:AAA domain/Bifunctional DNA primase/polymerase, N-terminal